MDFDNLINSVYDWVSFGKIIWFLLFFWISMPVLFFIPMAVELGLFYAALDWVVSLMYILMYVSVLLAFMVLTTTCLSQKKFPSARVTFNKALDTIFLVFLEFWYIFVWNMHKAYRFTQLLLLVGIALLYYYYTTSFSLTIELAYWIFVILYLLVVVYNCVRLSFSISIFYSKNCSIKEAVKESWRLTHKRFLEVLISLIIIFATVFVIFVIVSVVLGILANIVLVFFTTYALAYQLAVSFATLFALAPAIIGYHLGFAELYAQLDKKHSSEKRIKRVLARRTTVKKIPNKTNKTIKKKEAKKSTKKKTKSKKKITKKKKAVKKTTKKKTTSKRKTKKK
jgi:hypothetical protein